MNYKDYVNWNKMPTTWCPGCGIGIIFKQLTFTLEKLAIPKKDLVLVSGIGCSGRAAGYYSGDSVHGTHGRAVTLAEGIKRGNKKLKVIVFSGDGDLVGIGGNHLLHSSRRNIDLTVICVNNGIYGMTGGQMAPTTDKGVKTLTSFFGNKYNPINIQGIITSNDPCFYGRSTAFHLFHLQKTIKNAIQWEGFAFVDAISFCIENYGRRIGFKNSHEMLFEIKKKYKVASKPEGFLNENELGIITK
jgi:2-oxoglutarate ferredoxin oxidoreductase subunit beta